LINQNQLHKKPRHSCIIWEQLRASDGANEKKETSIKKVIYNYHGFVIRCKPFPHRMANSNMDNLEWGNGTITETWIVFVCNHRITISNI